ncbi:MAG: phosphate ABC transporter substrate-binding protein [Bacteroidia bacterium]
MKGSDTILPLSQAWAEAYTRRYSILTSVAGGGSGVGIANLQDGNTDIAMSSRPLKLPEKMALAQKKIQAKEVVVAWDVLAICVHPSNPIRKLSLAQVAAIYTGKITNWREVGGPNQKIIVYSRESSSGTYEFFRDEVLKGADFGTEVRLMPATGTLVQSLSQTPAGIGYVGIAYVTPQLKVLAISSDTDTTAHMPTEENTYTKRYPIARPLYYYYDVAKEAKVAPFIAFLLSEEGRAITRQIGYVPPP